MSVNATTIDVDTQSNDLSAQGNVSTRSKPTQAGSTAPPSALFSGDTPIVGSADKLVYTKSSSRAVYTGTAKARARLTQLQSPSQVTAIAIDYNDTTRNLNASGNVESTSIVESASSTPSTSQQKPTSGATQKTQTVNADTMAYDDTRRTATYKGAPVHVTTSDGDRVEGTTVVFTLEDDSSDLKSMKASTAVWATLSGGYEARGDVLTYDAKADTYTLDGRPGDKSAQVKSPQSDNPGSCNLHTGMRLVLNRNTGQVTVPGTGQAPQTVDKVACTMSLRNSK
jgi:lipopolysaccharide export system protein LptA